MKHEHDARIKQSTCPGCGTHLPSKGGLNSARYTISKEDSSTLHGLQPDSVLHLAGSAIHFWCAYHPCNVCTVRMQLLLAACWR